MVEVPFAEFERDFDAYMDRIEAGETFIVRKPDGTAVMAILVVNIKQDDPIARQNIPELIALASK